MGGGGIWIVCTDNINVSEWLKSRKAENGRAIRMMQAIIDYLIDQGVEIIPRYVQRGRSFACGLLSRTDEEGIKGWIERMGMRRVGLPNSRGDFCRK